VGLCSYSLTGYLLFSKPSFAEAIHRQGWIALGIGIVCTLIMGAAFAAGYGMTWEFSPDYTVASLLYQLLRSINTWAWLVFILSCSIRWLNRNNKVLRYTNGAVLPFYVLQQPMIILIAFYVVQWNLGILPKWLIISTLSLELTLAVYELLIRR
jgi:glucan biosynthesis protein C